MYQLFCYLINQSNNDLPLTKQAKGILLYPTINTEYDLHYQYDTHPIEIKTINLNQRWDKIDTRLKEIIGVE